MGHTIVIAGAERRRRWSAEQKSALLAAAFCPGGNVAEVARGAEICTSLLYRWRQLQQADRPAPAFMPAVIMDAPRSVARPGPGPGSSSSGCEAVIVVELAAGTRVTIASAASAAVISATLGALR
jgi:transposase